MQLFHLSFPRSEPWSNKLEFKKNKRCHDLLTNSLLRHSGNAVICECRQTTLVK
ncbi:hypothetical protein POUND7_006874 [Theobroma cacao]